MKTRDLIESLKESDPTGELHVKLKTSEGHGVVVGSYKSPGYYDGPFSYIENKKFIISDKGEKVEITSIFLDDFIFDNGGDTSNIILDVRDSIKEYLKKEIEEMAKEAIEFKKRSFDKFFVIILEKLRSGWKIIQKDHSPGGRYGSLFYIKDEEEDQLAIGAHEVIFKSDFFYLKDIKDRNDVKEWVFSL